MTKTFDVAHIHEQGVDLIIVPMDTSFGYKPYFLGAEDHSLSRKALDKCHHFIMIPDSRLNQRLNVSAAGSIITYDRVAASASTLRGNR